MSLKRRTQLLLDEDRHERLRRHAEQAGTSVGALIRRAIDQTFPAVPPERARAAKDLLSLPPMPVDDWAQLEREIEDGYERGPGAPPDG